MMISYKESGRLSNLVPADISVAPLYGFEALRSSQNRSRIFVSEDNFVFRSNIRDSRTSLSGGRRPMSLRTSKVAGMHPFSFYHSATAIRAP